MGCQRFTRNARTSHIRAFCWDTYNVKKTGVDSLSRRRKTNKEKMKPTVMSVPMGSATRTRSQTCPGERLKLQDQAQEEERTGETECVCFTQLYIALVEQFINYNIVFLGRQNQNQKSDKRKAQSTRIGEEERRSGIIGLWFQRSMILSGHKINKKNATKM